MQYIHQIKCQSPVTRLPYFIFYTLAYFLLNALPITMRRISEVPAPISYSLALENKVVSSGT